MHEMHLIEDLVADLLRLGEKQRARRITRVYVRLGELTEVNSDNLLFFFREKSRGTMLEKAELSMEKSSGRELRLLSFDFE